MTGNLFGLLVTGLNRYSLSRAQMLGWTLLLVAGLLTAAEVNLLQVYGPCKDTSDACGILVIDIPAQLLVAAGISLFSAVAAPALLSLKTDDRPDADATRAAAAKTGNLTGQPPHSVTTVGLLMANAQAADAHWTDFINGEEVGNGGSVDLSKV